MKFKEVIIIRGDVYLAICVKMNVAPVEIDEFVGCKRWNRHSKKKYQRHTHSHKRSHFGACSSQAVLGNLVTYSQGFGDISHLLSFVNAHSVYDLITL